MQSALRRDQLSGAILFQRNVRSAKQLRILTGSLRGASRSRALISVDQEGGLVRRIRFARPREGQPEQGSIARVKRVARQAATDLHRLGLNVNLAPVADVPTGPRSDIFLRAFRGSPTVVARKVVAATRGYSEGRVAATVKHFPGLGTAPRNTDNASVVIRRSARELRRVDLVPFRAAIAANVGLIMVAHAIYPAFDGARPASQSRPVLRNLLRDQLHYKGAVVTDALEARAVLRRQPVTVAAERSLLAGCDLLLVTSPSSYRPVFERIRKRALASPTLRRRVRESAARVLVLKRALGLRLPEPRA
jgi:beta-N-acetylhexosaminidase